MFTSLAGVTQRLPHSSKPGAQLVEQAPFTQLEPEAQVLPQAPQLDPSTRRLRQAPEQLVNSELQATSHWPDAQTAFPLAGTGQTRPQAPQLRGSLCEATQPPLHTMVLGGQVVVQTPWLQTWPEAQALPQRPQLAAFAWRSRQTPEQLVCPELHVGTPLSVGVGPVSVVDPVSTGPASVPTSTTGTSGSVISEAGLVDGPQATERKAPMMMNRDQVWRIAIPFLDAERSSAG